MAAELQQYWSGSVLAANLFIGANLVGAVLLGMLVGYERSYQGRAAGMRTYGLVCMASTAATVIVGFPGLWYGASVPVPAGGPDPTRVIQGVLTGIGFLCAGVIMKDGPNIRGLTTAASIWTVAAMGVLLGVGFYAAALLLAVLCTAVMVFVNGIESRLPGRSVLEITVSFASGHRPDFDEIVAGAQARGYRLQRDTLSIKFADSRPVWKFVAVAVERSRAMSPAELAEGLSTLEGIASFGIVPVRN